jgi:predicted MFS family arabinose efflux permease
LRSNLFVRKFSWISNLFLEVTMKKILCVLAAASMAFAPVFAQSTTPVQVDQPAPVTQPAPQAPQSLDGMQFAGLAGGVGTGSVVGGTVVSMAAIVAALAIVAVGLQQSRTSVTHKP